jgi:acetyltransferase-like isoleucine patch superfamily enzyme
MKTLIQKIINKKNPAFAFDENVSSGVLLSLLINFSVELIRANIKLLLNLKRPGLVFMGPGVQFFNASNIRIGRWTKIGKGVYLGGLGKKPLELGSGVGIGAYSQIIISTSFNNVGEYIKIGNNVGIGQYAYLGGAGGLEIKDNCIIGQYFSCHPENHNFDRPDQLIRLQGTTRKPITIEENCWIGAKVTVLAGVTIGANSVIAAGSVVTKDMPANSIIAGVPAKVIRER